MLTWSTGTGTFAVTSKKLITNMFRWSFYRLKKIEDYYNNRIGFKYSNQLEQISIKAIKRGTKPVFPLPD